MLKGWTLGWFVICLLCTSCRAPASTPAPGDPVPVGGDGVFGEALVEEVSIVFLESFPLQVRVAASGYLPNPCSWVENVTVERIDQHFKVHIIWGANVGEVCIQVEEPFEENIPLEVYGLPAGEYTIDVNGVQTQFTFAQDNILEEGG